MRTSSTLVAFKRKFLVTAIVVLHHQGDNWNKKKDKSKSKKKKKKNKNVKV